MIIFGGHYQNDILFDYFWHYPDNILRIAQGRLARSRAQAQPIPGAECPPRLGIDGANARVAGDADGERPARFGPGRSARMIVFFLPNSFFFFAQKNLFIQPGPAARRGQRGSASSAARDRFDLAPARPPMVMLRPASPGASPDAVGAAGTPAGGAALPTECRDSDASREREAIASHSDASVSRETDASARPWPGPARAGPREGPTRSE